MSALGKPLSMPVHTDMMDLPANTRLRKTSSSDGLVNISTPIFFHESRTSCSTSVSSVLSPAVSTMMIIGLPSGSRRILSSPRLLRPISSSSWLAWSMLVVAQVVVYSGL